MTRDVIVKCYWCNIKDTRKSEMEFEMTGETKPVRRNYHKDCWTKYQKHKEFLADEQVKKDELNETIKKIYGVKEVHSEAWIILERLRGGNPVFKNQQIGKRYREGYEYPLIKETFEYCSDTIEYWNSVKNFDGFMGAFRYAIKIIIDKIYVVEQRVENRKKQALMMEKHIENVEESENEFVSNYKKKGKSNKDITDFLDD